MARKRFLDGTIRIGDLTEISALRITQVNPHTGVRAFRVIALPGNEIIYWTFFRRKANRFIKEKAEELGVPVEFASDLYGHSLNFEFSYEPIEYVLGSVFFIGASVYLQITIDGPSALAGFLGGFGLVQSVQAYRARVAAKSL